MRASSEVSAPFGGATVSAYAPRLGHFGSRLASVAERLTSSPYRDWNSFGIRTPRSAVERQPRPAAGSIPTDVARGTTWRKTDDYSRAKPGQHVSYYNSWTALHFRPLDGHAYAPAAKEFLSGRTVGE